MQLRIHGENGYNKACKNCGEFFWAKRSDTKYCSSRCRQKHYRKRSKRKAFIQGLLSKFGLGALNKKEANKNEVNKKVDYARLTFILSIIGFLGSIGFYLGVLREVYSPTRDKQRIEQLQEENKQLQKTIFVIIEKEAADEGTGK